jgi:hypothetical protein
MLAKLDPTMSNTIRIQSLPLIKWYFYGIKAFKFKGFDAQGLDRFL